MQLKSRCRNFLSVIYLSCSSVALCVLLLLLPCSVDAGLDFLQLNLPLTGASKSVSIDGPGQVTMNPINGDLFVTSPKLHRVYQIKNGSATPTLICGKAGSGAPIIAALAKPYGIAMNPSTGLIYVGDTTNNRLMELDQVAKKAVKVSEAETMYKIAITCAFSKVTQIVYFSLDHVLCYGRFHLANRSSTYNTQCKKESNGPHTPYKLAINNEGTILYISEHHGSIRYVDLLTNEEWYNSNRSTYYPAGYHGGSIAAIPGYRDWVIIANDDKKKWGLLMPNGTFVPFNTKASVVYPYVTPDGRILYTGGPGLYTYCCIPMFSPTVAQSVSVTLTPRTPSSSLILTPTVSFPPTNTPSSTPPETQTSTLFLTETQTASFSTTRTHTHSFTESEHIVSSSLTLTQTPTRTLTESTSFEVTESLSRVVVHIRYVAPDDFIISEKGIGKSYAPVQRITLRVVGTHWNCPSVRSIYPSFFSTDGIEPAGFQARLASILPNVSSVIQCADDVLSFVFAKDEDFEISIAENITLSFYPAQGTVIAVDHKMVVPSQFIARLTLKADKPPRVATVPKAVMEGAKATAGVSSMATAAAGNPAMAVQGARTALIVAMGECEDNTLDGIDDFFTSPTQQKYSDGPLRDFSGAALWNCAVISFSCALHGTGALMHSQWKQQPFFSSASDVYFPALQAIIILPLLQPTAMAVTTIFRKPHLVKDQETFIAWGATIFLLVYLILMILLTTKLFGAKWVTVAERKIKRNKLRTFLCGTGDYFDLSEKDRAMMKRNGGKLPSYIEKEKDKKRKTSGGEEAVEMEEKLLNNWEENRTEDVSGPYSDESDLCDDEETLHNKRKRRAERIKNQQEAKKKDEKLQTIWVNAFFMLFDMCCYEKVWFAGIETAFNLGFGVLEGWRPVDQSGCRISIFVMCTLFLVLFLMICFWRPYANLWEQGFAVIITTIQLVASIATAVYGIGKVKPAIDIGGWSATSGMYLLSVKALSDIIINGYDMIKDKCCENDDDDNEEKMNKKSEAPDDGQEAGERNLFSSSASRSPLLTVPAFASPLMNPLYSPMGGSPFGTSPFSPLTNPSSPSSFATKNNKGGAFLPPPLPMGLPPQHIQMQQQEQYQNLLRMQHMTLLRQGGPQSPLAFPPQSPGGRKAAVMGHRGGTVTVGRQPMPPPPLPKNLQHLDQKSLW